MKFPDCDRCGGKIEDYRPFTITIQQGWEYLHTSSLCEQCYQTIKEVLEDGEIK